MTTVREAIDLVLAGVHRLPDEEVALPDALDRVLAEDVDSPLDLPAHTNSAMDGYAARAADVRGASQREPKRLRIVEEVRAGRFPTRALSSGEATRIFTGAAIPEGADTIVRQEDAEREGDSVLVLDDRDAGRNLRVAGEDLRRGARVFDAGTVLGPAPLGVLASMAKHRVRVVRRARVGILGSGDEIAGLDEREAILAGRKTASSNSFTLDGLVRRAGAEPVHLGIARDTLASMTEHFARGFAACDLLVSTAGVSVGEHDFVHAALDALGVERAFWKVRMRPGAPLGFGTVQGVPWIGLPGNPVSTMVCFELYVRPAILKMQGRRALFRRTVRAVTDERIATGGRLMHFLRAVVREEGGAYRVRLTGPQGSGILTSMARANALLVVPEDRNDIPAGETLVAIPLGDGWTESSECPV
ncbi:MAG: gephyrin-like molybdotransferase Glp [Gemmatimonadota bacterium]